MKPQNNTITVLDTGSAKTVALICEIGDAGLRYRGHAPDSDADQLAGLTGIPGLARVTLFGIVNLAALLLGGYRLWPGVFLGALLVNLATPRSFPTSAGIALGNTSSALLGGYLVRRFISDKPSFERLRDVLGLTGTKFGCGMALCGACTVHQNGKAVRSCVMTMRSAAGAEIRTIEALSPNGSHPVQKAWMKINVPQCGYCQSGQIMQAAALLKEKPKPTDRDIDDAMAGNICRCGTYQRIRAAIKTAAGVKA